MKRTPEPQDGLDSSPSLTSRTDDEETVDSLVRTLSSLQGVTFSDIQTSTHETLALQRLRHALIDDGKKGAREAFRQARGFQVLLNFLRILCQSYASSFSTDDQRGFFATLSDTLSVLGAALQKHAQNHRYFTNSIDEDGWECLYVALEPLQKSLLVQDKPSHGISQYLGILLATAVAEEPLSDLFTTLQKDFREVEDDSIESFMTRTASEAISKHMGKIDQVAVSGLLPLIFRFWSSIPSVDDTDLQRLRLVLPETVLKILQSSRRNLVACHTAGLFQSLSLILFDKSRAIDEIESYRRIGLLLLQQGLISLSDAYSLYAKATISSEAATFLLKALKEPQCPPSIHFDLSPQGFSSVDLYSLGSAFPLMTKGGYTLSIWAYFQSFDPHVHTTIFGAFDSSQKCFVLAYLEKDTKHFILQTAVKGSRPSVRFKSVAFEPGRWYHICILHRRPRTMSSSKASLFVNGEFCEQLKANYPSVPPTDSSNRSSRVQAFFGTPQDLAVRAAKGSCQSQWSLGSSVLFADTYSDDLISVLYQLGPRYYGNFQDCLGSFQTYSASAALNVRHESLNPGDSDQSDILSAVRQKASTLIDESSILINISPVAVLDDEDRNNVDESQLVKSLSRIAAKNLDKYIRVGGNAIAINAAVPAINEALTQSHGVTVLSGGPVVTVPQLLDDASWRVGGCTAVGLTIVYSAKSTEDVARAVEILFETVRQSWRNSEAMERDQGYAILSTLLRDKLGVGTTNSPTGSSKISPAIPTPSMDRNQLGLALLKLVLAFTGYNHDKPRLSVINNPLAYRILLVDTDTWRQADQAIQEIYFKQFITFAIDSQHGRFNSRRLGRMRALKKLLDALKAEPVTQNAMPFFMEAFQSLLPGAVSAEILRSIALFITFSVHKGKVSKGLSVRRSNQPDTPRRSYHSGSPEPRVSGLSRFKIGVEVLRLYSQFLCNKDDTVLIKKFARTVTNKWLLYLLSETSSEVVMLAAKVLARVLVVHGSSYVKKFEQRSGGFTIMRHRLKRWWHLPSLWPICFAILFDVDIAKLDLDRPFSLFGLVELFGSSDFRIVNPAMFEVIMGMLQNGLRTIVTSKPAAEVTVPNTSLSTASPAQRERLSMSSMAPPDPFVAVVAEHHLDTLHIAVRFLSDLQSRSQKFRDYTNGSSYVQDLLAVLFPVVVGSDIVNADVELNARESVLTFGDTEVVIRPLSTAPAILKPTEKKPSSNGRRDRRPSLRSGSSSYIMIPSSLTQGPSSSSHLQPHGLQASPVSATPQLNDNNMVVQSLLEIVIAVFTDQILTRKDFSGLGLFLKTPPGFLEHKTYFESWVLRNTLSQLNNAILLDQKILQEPRVLSNLARLASHVGEALYEGWFMGGSGPALDFSGSILEYLQRSDVAQIKSVRLCSQAIAVIRSTMFRIVLLSLSQAEVSEHLPFLGKLGYWQTVLLSGEDTHTEYLQLICYLLYASLVSSEESVRLAAANLWRIILVQRPSEASAILKNATDPDQRRLVSNFEKLVELDNETFLSWLDGHREELDNMFFGPLASSWKNFVEEENTRTQDTVKQRASRRKDKLRQWAQEEKTIEDTIRRHEVTFDHWTSNIHSSEQLKHQRTMQDQQDNVIFVLGKFEQMKADTELPVGFRASGRAPEWNLDQTEGRNRMRLRITPDYSQEKELYQSKRKSSGMPSLKIETSVPRIMASEALGVTPRGMTPVGSSPAAKEAFAEPFPDLPAAETAENEEDRPDLEESFELVDDPKEEIEGYEDKNRKVMRSLHRGDQVQHVSNVSRIIGLEAAEGLLIVGKDSMYLLDNFFQRADGEILNVWEASQEERDPYVRMITGRESENKKLVSGRGSHETKSWKWADVISVSKRRFLFRDVALELFFADGRSALLTTMSPKGRDELHALVIARAPSQATGNSSIRTDESWRFDALRSPDEQPQSFGSKFASVFGQGVTNPATRRWVKGEISNFHYLMLVNTMAGRTFNDLTQYPVFPWVIADYTSEELDLTNPKTFRDFSKPMGCQSLEREKEYKERYATFAEMSDHSSPGFHYGTHYSSAMIVTSYLIRLQPFVKSYLLLQGGSFDHADRMFFSIEKAWNSASRINMTDVRELTPEFFYLPEFLTNPNNYDFGTRQNNSQSISSVELPPWAKGDPKIFIAKHREALESPYVSRNIHRWIDLVFGHKQKGEAAVQAVNVFHHLSYQGAKDLDTITDPVERLATIGIIHNFGQTPHQVFTKPHPAREEVRQKYNRLDTAAESLTRLPTPLLNSEERVSSLSFNYKQDRLLCSAAFRLNMPPTYEIYMEWGFADSSVRFYSATSRKLLGHLEHLHIGQLSCALFADSTTLITSGTDCVISVWNVVISPNGKTVDLQPRSSLFGHRRPVTVLALSRSFSALLSSSADGTVILWDLNRLEFVRVLGKNLSVSCARINDVTGDIVLCHAEMITIYTLNGSLLLRQHAGPGPGSGPGSGLGDGSRPDGSTASDNEDTILCVAVYEGAGNEWLERDIILTGHRRGVVRVWSKVVRGDGFVLELIRQLNHVDMSHKGGEGEGGIGSGMGRAGGGGNGNGTGAADRNVRAGISCILPMAQVVYTGDEDGAVYEWDCVKG